MPRVTSPDKWTPVGVEDLEPIALEVVRSNANRSVIAGPGAGKTELLAQRACYLLQTGFCPAPRRILAISFKKDAAKNLKERVAQRCRPEEVFRFDSLTFDAFAKSLFDRFWKGLPKTWRPTSDYEIYFPNNQEHSDFLKSLLPQLGIATIAEIQELPKNTFEKKCVFGAPLLPKGIEAEDAKTWAIKNFWESHLFERPRSRLSFPMIGRLVELLLRVNPLLCEALRLTYSHVFMDEFQDTTHVQYDLVKTAFFNSKAVLTAVGDHKQQIMRWAMALDDSFRMFEEDFSAKRASLIRNYRSSPDLVRIQHALALTVDSQSEEAKSMTQDKFPDDACIILEFPSPPSEAEDLAGIISSSIQKNSLTPRDFVLLVKQKPQEYAPLLIKALQQHGLKGRAEAELQDLLAEPLTKILISFLRLGTKSRGGAEWIDCRQILRRFRGYDPREERQGRELQRELGEFHKTLAKQMETFTKDEASVSRLLETIVGFVRINQIKLLHPEYRQGSWFESVLTQVGKHLAHSCQAGESWNTALDDFEGRDAVPIMTIHKSKGLEYHTVIFVALDDSAWWSFRSQPEESQSAFFVAFSRAKRRIIFTYCAKRGRRKDIASLYDVLQTAGVQTRKYPLQGSNARPDDTPGIDR